MEYYWKKWAFSILVMIGIVTTLYLLYFNADRDVVEYKHSYIGLVPGHSSLDDMYSSLGEPVLVKKVGGGKNYHYEKVIVNFPGTEDSKVNTIIVYSDLDYVDTNGLKIGDDIGKINEVLKSESRADVVKDKENGLIYWLVDGQVDRIVLAKSMYAD